MPFRRKNIKAWSEVRTQQPLAPSLPTWSRTYRLDHQRVRGRCEGHSPVVAFVLSVASRIGCLGPESQFRSSATNVSRVAHAYDRSRPVKGHNGRFKAKGLGHTGQASPSGHSIARLDETVGDKPLPHVSAETASPAHATMTAASSSVVKPQGPDPILDLHPVDSLALPSVHLALAPCCTSSIAARLASLGWHVGWVRWPLEV